MRVALVHDWLTGLRGGERVLDELAGLFPSADLFTLVHVPGSTTPRIDALRIHTSPLQRWSGSARHYRELLPLLPWAVRQLRIDGYDLVISVHHAMAKAARIAPGTPAPLLLPDPDALRVGRRRRLSGRAACAARVAAPLLAGLRRFDRASAAPDRVTRLVAISEYVRDRVAPPLGSRRAVVYPPVDVETLPPGRAPARRLLSARRRLRPLQARRPRDRDLRRRSGGASSSSATDPLRAALERRVAARRRAARARLRAASWRSSTRAAAHCVYPQEEDFGIARAGGAGVGAAR